MARARRQAAAPVGSGARGLLPRVSQLLPPRRLGALLQAHLLSEAAQAPSQPSKRAAAALPPALAAMLGALAPLRHGAAATGALPQLRP